MAETPAVALTSLDIANETISNLTDIIEGWKTEAAKLRIQRNECLDTLHKIVYEPPGIKVGDTPTDVLAKVIAAAKITLDNVRGGIATGKAVRA